MSSIVSGRLISSEAIWSASTEWRPTKVSFSACSLFSSRTIFSQSLVRV